MTTRLDESDPEQDQAAGIEALLREVGARTEPSEQVRQDVHAAVQAEWRALVEDLRRQRRASSWARGARWAAGIACIALIAALGVRWMAPAEPLAVATITRIDGHLLGAAHDVERRTARAVAQSVHVGETLQTDDRSRAALAYAGNLSLRLDHNTLVKVLAPDRLALTSGALYVDASTQVPSAALTVEALAGSVRHVGTQYQVRTHADDIEVSIREGRVLVSNAGRTSEGAAGEKLRVTAGGEVIRTALAPHDVQWQWAASAAPAFDIENQPLDAFINWVARETGRKVVYASRQAEAAAAQVILRGSVAGLEPDTALNAVLATTQLREQPAEPGSIHIRLAEPADTAPPRAP